MMCYYVMGILIELQLPVRPALAQGLATKKQEEAKANQKRWTC